MSNTHVSLQRWERGEWPEYITVSHEGMREPKRRYVPERTCRIEYDFVHCDYICSECGEWFETGGVLRSLHNGEVEHVSFKFCPSCGAKVVE